MRAEGRVAAKNAVSICLASAAKSRYLDARRDVPIV